MTVHKLSNKVCSCGGTGLTTSEVPCKLSSAGPAIFARDKQHFAPLLFPLMFHEETPSEKESQCQLARNDYDSPMRAAPARRKDAGPAGPLARSRKPFECTLAQRVFSGGEGGGRTSVLTWVRVCLTSVILLHEKKSCVPSVLVRVVEASGGYADTDDIEGRGKAGENAYEIDGLRRHLVTLPVLGLQVRLLQDPAN